MKTLSLALLASFAGGTAAADARAQSAKPASLVTFAARVCSSYADITANKARNNIQESLRDLGPATPYAGGDVVDAATEERVQPGCRPLTGWRFTLGRGFRAAASTGTWGSLSAVTQPFAQQIVTRGSTPLLDDHGVSFGAEIAGAVTVELTPEQERLAAQDWSLWTQGGVPDDPVSDRDAPGQYGFGALRCAEDDVNGDNVERISFSSGRSHVVCFAYYVTPPPTAGTIVVRKQLTNAPDGLRATFPFQGSVSFEPDGGFGVEAGAGEPGMQTFHRAATRPGEQPWTFREIVPDDWRLTDLSCVSELRASETGADASRGEVRVWLAAGDTVTCTYTDAYEPRAGGLLLQKATVGGTGSFPFTIAPLAGTDPERTALLRTTREGTSAASSFDPLPLAPGDYQVRERLPAATPAGSWALRNVVCGGRRLGAKGAQRVTVVPGATTLCTYTNAFTPAGRIVIRTITLGGTAATTYGVRFTGDPSLPPRAEQVRTRRDGVAAKASGDRLTALDLGSYTVHQGALTAAGGGRWELVLVVCDGQAVPFSHGTVDLSLTRTDPSASCTFINRLVHDPPRTTPTGRAVAPGDGPGTLTEPSAPGATRTPVPSHPPTATTAPDPLSRTHARLAAPRARLTVTKRADRRVVRLGQTVTYRVVVANRGLSPAVDVSLAERFFSARGRERLVSIRSSRGGCTRLRLGAAIAPACRLGTLAPGERATVVAVVRPLRTGHFANRAVTSTDTATTAAHRPTARARVVVIDPAPAAPIDGRG